MQELFKGMQNRLEHAMDTKFAAIKINLTGKMEAIEGRLDAKIERVETNLLTEFHKWASPMDARMRTHAATLRALDLEMEALSDRVRKLEGDAA